MSGDPCTDAEHSLQAYIDRVLTPDETEAIDRHLRVCSYCAERYRFETDLRSLVKRCCCDCESETPPGMVDRLRERCRSVEV
ncbi:MAG TPA: zf-HC2 domain-containing protein [Thermoleophilia bacterium]|nr:zf-HC2 domain-containing protein [Thermoleophilia bacterium]